MSYEDLVNKRIIEPVEVEQTEIVGHLQAAERDITTAQNIASIDLDWAFNIAYNGILQTALAYMYSLGFRPRGEGKHLNTFRFLKAALPESYRQKINRL